MQAKDKDKSARGLGFQKKSVVTNSNLAVAPLTSVLDVSGDESRSCRDAAQVKLQLGSQ